MMTKETNRNGSGDDKGREIGSDNRLERPRMLSDYQLLSQKDLIGDGAGQRGLIPVSRSTLWQWERSGYFRKSFRFGGRRFWRWVDVRAFIEAAPSAATSSEAESR